APDNHLVSCPDGGLALAPRGGAGGGCRCPLIGRTLPAASGIGKRETAGILTAPNDHLVSDIYACENRGMRRARGGCIHNRDRRPAIGESHRDSKEGRKAADTIVHKLFPVWSSGTGAAWSRQKSRRKRRKLLARSFALS